MDHITDQQLEDTIIQIQQRLYNSDEKLDEMEDMWLNELETRINMEMMKRECQKLNADNPEELPKLMSLANTYNNLKHEADASQMARIYFQKGKSMA